MAYVQNTGEFHSVWDRLGAPFRAIFGALVNLSEANVRVREIDRLHTMSDAELNRLGLTREGIVRHVFHGSL